MTIEDTVGLKTGLGFEALGYRPTSLTLYHRRGQFPWGRDVSSSKGIFARLSWMLNRKGRITALSRSSQRRRRRRGWWWRWRRWWRRRLHYECVHISCVCLLPSLICLPYPRSPFVRTLSTVNAAKLTPGGASLRTARDWV